MRAGKTGTWMAVLALVLAGQAQAPRTSDLDLETVNGGIDIDFPVTVSGRIGRQLRTTLGDGGPTIRVVTTNGGVKIKRR